MIMLQLNFQIPDNLSFIIILFLKVSKVASKAVDMHKGDTVLCYETTTTDFIWTNTHLYHIHFFILYSVKKSHTPNTFYSLYIVCSLKHVKTMIDPAVVFSRLYNHCVNLHLRNS